ncbi:Transcription termination factor like [Actinidia chinensis var. chinensis]|uniref:Transcription termination factor like n=1 Tax=Actinidia chinensis var. chinensis TaxID=1590841 RepID=A0A2R6P4D7_ACTCC|nr:Transcription termination factor like [Actinidia chinensis var. chinensis]
MSKFIRKTSHYFKSARASPTHNLCFVQIQPLSSSLKPIKNSPNQHSFTVSYLINSCGFSLEKALSVSEHVKFEASDKPDSVLALFESHGFTQTQILTIIRNYPPVLLSDPKKTLLPKLEFLKSKGISSTDVTNIVATSPSILRRSLEKNIIPSFNFFNNLLQSEKKTLAAIKSYYGFHLSDRQTRVTPNVETLREAGVPNVNIMYLLTTQPRLFMASNDSFGKIVKEVEKMGFNPLKVKFVLAVQALIQMTKSTWEKKVDVYKKWGWTEEEILVAFKKNPWCMAASEDKINGVMNFLVNNMGMESSLVVKRTKLISLSLEKRIVPRCAAYQVLLSKGLIKSNGISLMTLIMSSEKQFLEKVVNRHKEEAPELLKLYKENLDLSK